MFVVAEFNKGYILPTLIRQLQSILQQYPDDGQILKVAVAISSTLFSVRSLSMTFAAAFTMILILCIGVKS